MYLNKNGYSVTETKTERFLSMMRYADFSDYGSVLPAMKLTFCRNREEAGKLPELFRAFMEDRRSGESIEEKKDFLEKSRNEDEDFRKSAEEDIGKIEQDIDRTAREIRERNLENMELKFQNQAKLKKHEKAFLRLKLSSGKKTDFIKKCVAGKDAKAFVQYTEREIKDIRAEIYEKAKAAMLSGKAVQFEALTALYKAIDHLTIVPKKVEAASEKEIAEQTKKFHEKIAAIRKEMREREAARKRLQQEIDRLMREQKMRSVEKKGTLRHREEFFGKNAVRSEGDPDRAVFEKPFMCLSEKEKRDLMNYIRKNILRFKTRMTRNINTSEVRKIDLLETIRTACRTGGKPMKIEYIKPRRSKADIMMVLDVSGSCREASEMMLSFIGILKEVFPRGCRAYAFVNSLYDITSVYDSGDLEEAVTEALNLIPRRGVYSDYNTPLRTLWEKYRNRITKDTIVVLIGDARNNSNPSGEEYMKNICRRAKSAYFLNTEEKEQWDMNDSVAGLYGKYAKMYKTETAGEILRFLEEVK